MVGRTEIKRNNEKTTFSYSYKEKEIAEDHDLPGLEMTGHIEVLFLKSKKV